MAARFNESVVSKLLSGAIDGPGATMSRKRISCLGAWAFELPAVAKEDG